MAVQNTQVFSGILNRPTHWRRLGGSGLAVSFVYTAILIGALVAADKAVPTPKRKLPKSLTVTLYDAPKTMAPKNLEDTGGAAAGAGGEATFLTPAEQTGPKRTAPPKPAKAVSQTEAKTQITMKAAIATAPSEDPKPAPPVLTPAPLGETNSPSPNLATTAAGPSTAPGLPGGTGTTGAPGGAGGSGTGTSTGTGSGWKVGTASGDTTVLPFMDGMSRPSQVGALELDFPREARESQVKGLILAECTITTSGSLKDCKIMKGLPYMDQPVLTALARARYTPVIYQGKPATVRMKLPIPIKAPE